MDVSGKLHVPPIYPRGMPPGTQWIGSWVGPRTGLYVMKKRKFCVFRESNPGSPARITSPYQPSYPGTLSRDVVLHMKMTSEASQIYDMKQNNLGLFVYSIRSDDIYSSVNQNVVHTKI
jgi:hypothetical protein